MRRKEELTLFKKVVRGTLVDAKGPGKGGQVGSG